MGTEAASRGLLNYSSTPKCLLAVDCTELYARTNTMTSAEVEARKNVQLENYIKAKQIEGRCMYKMSTQYFIPAGQKALARMGAANAVAKVSEVTAQIDLVGKLLGQILREQAAMKKALRGWPGRGGHVR